MSEDNEDILNDGKKAVSAVGDLIKAAGDTPESKEAAKNIGKTAVTLTKTLDNVLLPLSAFNWGVEKAKTYFNSKFKEEIKEKTKNIPKENLITPKTNLVGPAIQGLAYNFEEYNLKEMFLNLISNGMDSRKKHITHPSFVEIINQLSPDEAGILKIILKSTNSEPICRIYARHENGTEFRLFDNIISLVDDNNQPEFREEYSAYIDNWVRLGLINVDYGRQITDKRHYECLTNRPEINMANEKIKAFSDSYNIQIYYGIFYATGYGILFSKAVGINQ